MNYLLDTNVVSEGIRRNPHEGVMNWLAGADEDRLFLSVITVAEIEKGIELLSSGAKKRLLQDWLEVDVLNRFEDRLIVVDAQIAMQWGMCMAVSKKKGIALSAVDALVAATCIVHNLILVTRDTNDFQHLDLPILNPWLV